MSGERVDRRLAAVLAADVAGYSRLMGRDEERTLAELEGLRKALVDAAIAYHSGRISKASQSRVVCMSEDAHRQVRGRLGVSGGILCIPVGL